MHRCLQIRELIDMICRAASHSDRASLARTCKAIYEPAMDALLANANCDTFVPLIKSMPSDLVEETEEMHDDDMGIVRLRFRRQPEAEEWDMFRKHAHRVRVFQNGSDDFDCILRDKVLYEYTVHEHTLSIITSYVIYNLRLQKPAEPLFPNLLRLVFSSLIELPVVECGAYLAGQNTRDLVIDSGGEVITEADAQSLSGLLCDCKVRLPRLETIDLNMSTELVNPAFWDLICSRPTWKRIDLRSTTSQSLNEETLVHLSTLPSLVSFSCFNLYFDGFSFVPKNLRQGTLFTSLQNLDIKCEHLRTFTELIRLMEPRTKLQGLWINVSDELPALEVERLCAFLAEHCPFLQSFSVILGSDPDPNPEYVLLPSVFHSLLLLPEIQVFQSTNMLMRNVDDAFVERLAKSWPKLQNLNFCWDESTVFAAPKLTLHSLLSLSRYCPDLENLDVHLDTTKLPDESVRSIAGQDGDKRPRKRCKLRTLSVGDSLLHEEAAIPELAKLLCELFPELRTVRSEGMLQLADDVADLQYKRWREVNRLVHITLRPDEPYDDWEPHIA